MFNRKKYIIFLIVFLVIMITAIVVNSILPVESRIDWLWIILIGSAGYIYLKYRVSGPLQLFASKFTMLVDYDINVAEAERIAYEGMVNAPTKNVGELYRVYYGMSQYYSGKYEDAIKTFNTVELKRLNVLYHILIFAFTCYSAFELGDEETFNIALDRIKNSKSRVPGKYTNFVASYEEILEAIKNIDTSLDNYKDVIERHFSRNDGYITTKLIYNYRLALYFEKLGDDLERDKCLAFVIANGKEHHTALGAIKKFKGLVKVEDYIIKEEIPNEEIKPEEVEQIETVETVNESDNQNIDDNNEE
ncbi:MAG: hypothetical protein CVV58_01010 [Tenericutes bacterium HGW-Tenericutes-3]|jgi:hypothetical protein|nr:MAG: hypothetical protein CVV58_01010 [Tenericutes bacterium HGW-Tenericutes-3]